MKNSQVLRTDLKEEEESVTAVEYIVIQNKETGIRPEKGRWGAGVGGGGWAKQQQSDTLMNTLSYV